MTSLPEQLSAARKAQLEAQLELLSSLSTQAISSAERLISLNLNATRASLEQTSAAARQLLESREPRDFLAFGTQTQQQFQQMMDYGRNLFSIAAGAQLDLQKAIPQLVAAHPVAAPAPSAAPAAASVAPAPVAPAPQAAPAAAAAAPQPAPAPVAAAPAPVAAAPVAAQSRPAMNADADPLSALAQAAHSALPQKMVEVEEHFAAPENGPKETAIASAAGQMAAAAGAHEHPLASPVPGKSGKIEIPRIAPVEASPPPPPVAGTPVIEAKQAEQRSPKGSRKK